MFLTGERLQNPLPGTVIEVDITEGNGKYLFGGERVDWENLQCRYSNYSLKGLSDFTKFISE